MLGGQIINKVVEEYAKSAAARAAEIPGQAGKSTVDLLMLAPKGIAAVYGPVLVGMPLEQVLAFYRQNPWLMLFIAGSDKWLSSALDYVAAKAKQP